jgi:phage gp45-like
MIRAIIETFSGALLKIARFSAWGHSDEYIHNRETLQHYGFASRPLKGAEGIVIREGNHLVMIADDDRRYRIALEMGEVALYTDEGDKIHIKRGGNIIIQGSSKVQVFSPHIELLSGDEEIDALAEKLFKCESFQRCFNTHTQTGGFVCPTSPPTIPSTPDHLSQTVKNA